MAVTRIIRFKFRRDIKAVWELKNPILLDGEPGVENDTGRSKIGDGVHRWTELDYFFPSEDVQAMIDAAIANGNPGDPTSLAAHINSPTPHPVYDDGPSLALLYQNAKV